MSTNDKIWKKIKSEYEKITIDTADCGAIKEGEDFVECDDEYTCPKHSQQWQDHIAEVFRTAIAKEIFAKLEKNMDDFESKEQDDIVSEIFGEFWRIHIEPIKKEYKVD